MGDYARVLHKLSVVLHGQPSREEEAAAKKEEAEAVARVRLGLEEEGACVADDEQTYDMLVYVLWR